MPYTKIKLASVSNNGKKAFSLLMNELNIPIHKAQSIIDKKRLFCNDKLVIKKNELLKGEIELIVYKSEPRGVELCFENEDFAVLEKLSGVLSHPNGRNCTYSLSDEIYTLWGQKAGITHRLDRETSGLIIVAKNENIQKIFKAKFQNGEIYKEYEALVYGKTPLKFSSNKPLALSKNYDDIKTRMCIDKNGKKAFSEFELLQYFKDFNISLIKCLPHTGRQHQLRLHLFDLGYKILGECLYGLCKKDIERILDKKINDLERINLTGATRLCLHASVLKFDYKGRNFYIKSKKSIKNELLNLNKFKSNFLG
ncbi:MULTISPECIES: RluA family pseudouridine synthase [unclassified Campylobacter]|uniref:RluA family pseudouridine synthase n=1 Tax=unclassified Campylobacter TaxID=2593542 RepID=UPI00123813BF|nr:MULTISPECIES: RluA family pseudouridine synthase [unclassified Campylobacter]KAA6224568.1 RluA family pseudouridine synthase [Campylobacter sp. LR185c]KAA6224915.1 RluA family pseudouridine synthase [Campylobacter sp. LR196d]KAA6225412.1 RluA family pseudouridine synthase [Campylobacter sp. LR286c]KAA6229116.1 RluA family pseudouridine synthase [Campylobacter sp. LR291e]KAA6229600.1 RluA family pseudouridine synthase [Campylobacter sp. LR264d]